MYLWIRSQDRDELIKIDNIYITTCNGGWAIRSGITLGKYRTQERALEILNKIQTLLIGKKIINLNNGVQRIESLKLDNIVYEMPEE